jgi:raffinose/stachyose/melibiose transport system substrate-binding protein
MMFSSHRSPYQIRRLRMSTVWALGLFALLSLRCVPAQGETLTLETWRGDDTSHWVKEILPAFNRTHPTIKVRIIPTVPTRYDKVLEQKLATGTAGDLITCRPFDQSLNLYNKGYLQDITAMPELLKFRNNGKVAWTTYFSDREFCMPMAAVMTGFFYNTTIFKELDLSPPQTEEEFFKVLEKIKASGKYVPLAFGTKDSWQSAQVLFAAIGPNYWSGEQGRINLLTGRAKFTDSPYVEVWRTLDKLDEYFPDNHRKVGEKEARDLFLQGKAAIYPAGSWEIPFLSESSNAKNIAVFASPPKQDQNNCYVLNHLDIGVGINAKSAHSKTASDFLAWLSTPDFSQALVNSLPGFFPLSNHPVEVSNPLAKEMLSWRKNCDTTIRINSQFLNQAWPGLEQELWRLSAQVMRHEISPEEAAKQISNGVEKWFKPF